MNQLYQLCMNLAEITRKMPSLRAHPQSRQCKVLSVLRGRAVRAHQSASFQAMRKGIFHDSHCAPVCHSSQWQPPSAPSHSPWPEQSPGSAQQ